MEQVLRYSALGVGIFYGFYHQRTLSSAQKVAERQQEYEHKQTLINKAKEAYAKSKQPASATTGGCRQNPHPLVMGDGAICSSGPRGGPSP